LPARNKSSKGFVGILVAELHFPECGSLKGKRMFMRSMRDQISRRFGGSFAEVGYQDLWQRTRILAAVAASDLQTLEGTMGRLESYLQSQEWMVTSFDTEVVDVDA